MARHTPIMLLEDECYNKIFSYLTLRELTTVSETCSHWKKLAGKYYGENFKSKGVGIGIFDEHILQRVDNFETTFGSYAYDVQIFNFVFHLKPKDC